MLCYGCMDHHKKNVMKKCQRCGMTYCAGCQSDHTPCNGQEENSYFSKPQVKKFRKKKESPETPLSDQKNEN